MAVIISNLDVSRNAELKLVDLELDFRTQSSNISTTRQTLTNDVAVLANVLACRQRLINLVATNPGQMVLDPTFGCNLSQYLFVPVSTERGYIIGRYIRGQVERFIPQITLEKIVVSADADLQRYDIEVAFLSKWTGQRDKTNVTIDRNAGHIQYI